MTTYAQDRDGKYIPASQRPDGTWRKARRVKDGYVPQEEVPLYESKGKLFMKKPAIPVGMCPIVAQQTKEKREKQQQKQNQVNPIPRLYVLSNSTSNDSNQKKKQKAKTPNGVSTGVSKVPSKKTSTAAPAKPKAAATGDNATKSSTTRSVNENDLCEAVSDLNITNEEDLTKKLKKLRKKIREIEAIEAKMAIGELKKPDPDQLEKVGRKSQILDELKELEQFECK